MKNTKQFVLAGLALAMMGVVVAVLLHIKVHQRLGDPGVKTRPIAGSQNLEILMPETASGGYDSHILTNNEAILTALPPDTSYRVRLYKGQDDFSMEMTTVLMGTDRSSIHQPQICLPGQGWAIDDAQTKVVNIPMSRPVAYDLPVNKIICSSKVNDQDYSGIFVYWYVDGDRYTASSTKWKLLYMPRDLLTRGVMDRWAYISCWTACPRGQEEATFARMEKLIADAVPEFQLVPHAAR